MTRVAYVVTLYNKSAFLPHMLAGLHNQIGTFERSFIFVDDGSTDDTLNKLRALTVDWENVTILEQPNLGPSAALNRGLETVDADFVKPVDGDDILTPYATALLLEAIERSGCSVAYANHSLQGRYDVRDDPGTLLDRQTVPNAPWQVETRMLRLSLRSAQTNPTVWLARTSAVDAAGGCDPAIFIQDYSIELRLAVLGPFVRVDAPLVLLLADSPDRLSRQEAQTLHDVNFAVLRLLGEHPEIPRSLARYGLKRAAGRAWAWARRHNRKSVLSREYWWYLRACVGWIRPTAAVAEDLTKPFRETVHIRLPKQP